MAVKKKAAKGAASPEAAAPPAKPVAKKAPEKVAGKAPPKPAAAPVKPAAVPAKPAAKAPAPPKPAAPPAPPAAKAPSKPAAKDAALRSEPAKKPAAPPAKGAPAPKPAAKPAPKEKPLPAAKPPPKPRLAALDDEDEPEEDDLDEDEDDAEEPKAETETEDDELPVPAAQAHAVGEEVATAEAPPKPVIKRVVPPMPPRKPGVITVAFSPDADDAFMLYGLANGKVDTETRKYELVRGDIAGLNAEAQKGTYDVTAFSFGAWPQVSERYLVLPCGGSFGDQVGPVVVAKTPVRSGEVHGLSIAVPGKSTTAALVLRMWLFPNKINLIEVPFQQVGLTVKAGKARAGLLIHEAQLTYKTDGLTRVMDLGQWWGEKTEGLPLPLGGTAIRRDIPADERAKVALDLKRSIAYALGHREEALDYATPFGRGLPRPLLDKYISMYVNELTLDYGERGKQAVHALFDEAVRLGLLKERTDLEFSA
jgi:1,4-dihydroxy-6-naphthoate synthase